MVDALKDVAIAAAGLDPSSDGASASSVGVLEALMDRFEEAELRRLLDRQLERPDWHSLHLAFTGLESETTPLSAYLVAMQAAVRLARLRGAPRWRTQYPAGSSHAARVRDAMAEKGSGARQKLLLDLLAADLYEQGVLNLNLMKYLLVQCRHEVEERQFQALLSVLKEGLDGQTVAA